MLLFAGSRRMPRRYRISSAVPAPPVPIPSLDQAAARAEFVAAMQRVRLQLPEPPDSAMLKAYPIYDYLLAARLRRDLAFTPSEELDAAIDTFLRAHEGEPVGRSLKHQWLVSLAQRRRWDWFLPRAARRAPRHGRFRPSGRRCARSLESAPACAARMRPR